MSCTHPKTTVYPCFPQHGEHVYTEAVYCDHCGVKVGNQNTQHMQWPPCVEPRP